ncbi:GNAT family N-acetyltransferase [Sphingomonas hengshuiensis]|nr:GNAT family N-acetyltransferase [Sphingomonas hengshuiensis]
MPFLRDLFGGFRALEMALVPWSAEQKRALLDDQFRLQHTHFLRYFPRTDFWIVTQGNAAPAPAPIGRLYLDRSSPEWRIIDIGLMPPARAAGVGSALIEWVQRSAREAGAAEIALDVAHSNPLARRLYLRLGFVEDGVATATHQPMRWRVPIS